MRNPFLVAVIFFASTGCVILPVAIPPLQVQLGKGAQSLSSADATTGESPVQFRIAARTPQPLHQALFGNDLDLGVGFLSEARSLGLLQGGYLEGGAVLLGRSVAEGVIGRLSARAQARIIHTDPEQRWGPGGALQLGWDFIFPVDGQVRPDPDSSDGSGFLGYAYGEYGLGVYAEGSTFAAGALTGWAVSGGVSLRLPFLAGIVWFPLGHHEGEKHKHEAVPAKK